MTVANGIAYDPNNIFARILRGEIPSKKLFENEHAFAFHDINPQAPVHVLVVPREHHPNAAATALADPTVLAEMVATAQQVAAAEGHDDYRLVFNTGADAGQTVFHTHLHVLAGRGLSWPPG